MSWDVRLRDQDGKTLEAPRHSEGGTYELGGTTDTSLNVTYNYSECFSLIPGYSGLKETLHEKSGRWTLPWLEQAVDLLGTRTWVDYWAPTPGNAGYALALLRDWARLHPDGIWEVL